MESGSRIGGKLSVSTQRPLAVRNTVDVHLTYRRTLSPEFARFACHAVANCG